MKSHLLLHWHIVKHGWTTIIIKEGRVRAQGNGKSGKGQAFVSLSRGEKIVCPWKDEVSVPACFSRMGRQKSPEVCHKGGSTVTWGKLKTKHIYKYIQTILKYNVNFL